MARFHKNLKYHKDNVEKHPITEEDISFLSNLQKEMNTQDTVGQADPRYWVIKGTEIIYGIDDEFACGWYLYDSSLDVTVHDLQEAFEYLQEYHFPTEEFPDVQLEYDHIVVVAEDGESEILANISDVADWLSDKLGLDNSTVVGYREVPKYYPGFFLTQKAAKEHLRQNHYHYSEDAHTYAVNYPPLKL